MLNSAMIIFNLLICLCLIINSSNSAAPRVSIAEASDSLPYRGIVFTDTQGERFHTGLWGMRGPLGDKKSLFSHKSAYYCDKTCGSLIYHCGYPNCKARFYHKYEVAEHRFEMRHNQ